MIGRNRIYCLLSFVIVLVGCNARINGPISLDIGEVQDPEDVGGIWTGSDDTGLEIYAISRDAGGMRWVIPATGEQGFGFASAVGTSLEIYYTYVAPLGSSLSDGATSANCTATGTIAERDHIDVRTWCDTTANSRFENSALLTYSALYDRDSSLATIAGNYDDQGLVLNVNGAGEIFEQNPESGCIMSGQVSIIDSRYNAYDIWITYSDCVGDAAALNGTRFSGLGTLDDSVNPEQLFVALVGDVDGLTYSVVYVLPKL